MSVVNSIRSQLSPINPEGYPFIGGFALASLILFWIWTPLGWIGTLLTLWCALFFRGPIRVTPVAPAFSWGPAPGGGRWLARGGRRPDDASGAHRRRPVATLLTLARCPVSAGRV